MPSLASIPRYSTDALKLIEQAGGVRDQKAKEEGYAAFVEVYDLVRDGKFTEAEAERYRGTGLFEDGRLASLTEQSTNNRLASEQQFLNDQAKRQARFASEQAEQQVYTQAFSELLGMNGTRRIHDVDVVNVSGEGTRTVSRNEIIENAATMFEQAMSTQEQAYIDQGMPPTEASRRVRQQKLMWYSQNGIENKEWSDMLNGIASRGTISVLLERGEIGAQLGEQAELYRELLAANPAYLSTMLTNATAKQFFEAYDRGVTMRRMPKEAALHYAASRVTAPDSVRVQTMLKPEQTDSLARDVLRSLGYDADRASNYYDVVERITQMSLDDMTESEIRTAIRSELENTTVEINGMLVRDHRDLPKDFPELVDAELQEALEVFGKDAGITDTSDLYIYPVEGQSAWQIRVKSLGGIPLGNGTYITPQSLDRQRGIKDRKHDEMVLQMIRASDAERARYQERYEAEIAQMEGWIEKYRTRTGKLSGSIADYLQGVLDDRLERDRILREMTPEKVQEELARVRRQVDDAALNGAGAGLGSWSPVTPPLD